jgi:hypothetical protein
MGAPQVWLQVAAAQTRGHPFDLVLCELDVLRGVLAARIHEQARQEAT